MPEITQETKVLIWSHEHNAWWRPNKYGYTTYKSLAGLYSLAEAVQICHEANRYLSFDDHTPEQKHTVPNETIYFLEQ